MAKIIAERLDKHKIIEQVQYFNEMEHLKQAFDSTNVLVTIINNHRQIVFINKAFLDMLKANTEDIIGKRTGEIIDCIHSNETVNGCGTTEACSSCGTVNAILKAMDSKMETANEAVITRKANEYSYCTNLLVHVVPINVKGETFYVMSFMDIGDTVRRRSLERIFFHDILNTAGALKGLLGLMKNDVPDGVKPEVEFVEDTFKGLIEEIQSQKQLLEAENDELGTEIMTLMSTEVIHTVANLIRRHEVAEKKNIAVDEAAQTIQLKSDLVLLRRVLGNMLKNALEATKKGETVFIGCEKKDVTNEIEFWVKNSKYMEKSVQNQIFQRSFSTKGAGRGTGTYSMKLLGEKYLHGKVGFSSDIKTGTKFYIRLPIKM